MQLITVINEVIIKLQAAIISVEAGSSQCDVITMTDIITMSRDFDPPTQSIHRPSARCSHDVIFVIRTVWSHPHIFLAKWQLPSICEEC